MKKSVKTEIEFDGDELIRRLESFADHATGKKRLTLRTSRFALPCREKPLNAREIANIRKALGVSQAVFAALLNVPKPTAISWESGSRQPSGAALKLLRIAQRHPKVLAA